MKKTDYSKIAGRYDNNELRHKIAKDLLIEKICSQRNQKVNMLDLACGTGNYIERQAVYYKDYNIKWYGLDLSAEMLQKAKGKNLNAELIQGDALNLPYDENFFDYIKLRFAFHHFPDKAGAIEQIYRVLKPDGILSMENICHDYMKRSWVYEYFPSAEKIDKKRFPSSMELYERLASAGFKVEAEIKIYLRQFLYKNIIGEVKNRDMSQLTLISENEYLKGLKKMEEDSKKTGYFSGDIAFLNFICEKNKN